MTRFYSTLLDPPTHTMSIYILFFSTCGLNMPPGFKFAVHGREQIFHI